MMHLFSFFGFESESHTRERRLIFNEEETPKEETVADLKKELGDVHAELRSIKDALAQEKALVEEFQTRAKKDGKMLPHLTPGGSPYIPVLHNRTTCGNCVESQNRCQQYEASIENQGGCNMPEPCQRRMRQYPSPCRESHRTQIADGATKLHGEGNGVYQVMRFDASVDAWQPTGEMVTMGNIVDPLTRAQHNHRLMHPSALRHFHTQHPWVATSGRGYAARRAEPDPYNHSDNMVQRRVLDLGGNAIATGMNSVYVPRTVRTDGQNPYTSGEPSSGEETSSMRMAKIHQNLTTSKIEMGAYRDLDDVPAAQEAIEQYNLDMAVTPGEGHNHVALLRTRLDTIRQMKKNRDIYAKGRTLFPDEALEKRYIEVGQELDSEVRIQVQSKNNSAKYETIRFYPNRLGLLNDEHSAQLANQYGIFCEPEMVNGHARGANIYFTKPGTFELNGEEIESVGKSSFRVPVSKTGDSPDTLDVITSELVEVTNDGKTIKEKRDTSIAKTKTDDIRNGESRALDQNVTVSRDEGGDLWVTFNESGTYTVNGTYDDNKAPSVSATYNAQPKEETQGERELRFIKTVGPELSADDAKRFLKLGSDTLNLEKVKTITPEAATVLAEYKGRLVLHLADWSAVATPLSNFKGEMLIVENNDRTPVSAGVLAVLVTSPCGTFRPMGIPEITDEIATALGVCQAKKLEVLVAKTMSPGSAEKLASYTGELWLSGIESITDNDAKKFLDFKSTKLILNGLTLTDEQAKILAPMSDKLQLNSEMTAKLLEAKKALTLADSNQKEDAARNQLIEKLESVSEGVIKPATLTYNVVRERCKSAFTFHNDFPDDVIIEVTSDLFGKKVSVWKNLPNGAKGEGVCTVTFNAKGYVSKAIALVETPNPVLERDKGEAREVFDSLIFPSDVTKTPIRITEPKNHLMWEITKNGQSCFVEVGYVTTDVKTDARELRLIVLKNAASPLASGASFTRDKATDVIAKVNELLTTKEDKNVLLEERLQGIEAKFNELKVKFPKGTRVEKQVSIFPDIVQWNLLRDGAESCGVKVGFIENPEDGNKRTKFMVSVDSNPNRKGYTPMDPEKTEVIIDKIAELLSTDEEKKTLLQERVDTLEKFNDDTTITPGHPGYEKLLKGVGGLCGSDVNSQANAIRVGKDGDNFNVFLYTRGSGTVAEKHLGTVSFNAEGSFRKKWEAKNETPSTTPNQSIPAPSATPSSPASAPVATPKSTDSSTAPSAAPEAPTTPVPPVPTLATESLTTPPPVPQVDTPAPEQPVPVPKDAETPTVVLPTPNTTPAAPVETPAAEPTSPKPSEVNQKSPEETLQFVKNVILDANGGIIDLNSVTELTPDIAKEIAQSGAVVVRLEGVKNITKDVATKLANFNGKILNLIGVTEMDDESLRLLLPLRKAKGEQGTRVYFTNKVKERFEAMK